jgi:hypothetical protein
MVTKQTSSPPKEFKRRPPDRRCTKTCRRVMVLRSQRGGGVWVDSGDMVVCIIALLSRTGGPILVDCNRGHRNRGHRNRGRAIGDAQSGTSQSGTRSAIGDAQSGTRNRGRAIGDIAIGDIAIGDIAIGDIAIGDIAIGDIAIGDRHHFRKVHSPFLKWSQSPF